MPELPEVETIKNDLMVRIAGDTIVSVRILDPFNLRDITPKELQKKLTNKKVISVNRIGKMIEWDIESDLHLLFHLKMTGKFEFCGSERCSAHARVLFEFSKAGWLHFSDIRKFGVIYLKKDIQQIKYIKNLGLEPLSEVFTFDSFSILLHKFKTKNLKNFLMDQTIITGIGNIYASEILFAGGLSPARSVGSLKLAESRRLFDSIRAILIRAIQARGTTFSDYRDARGNKGTFQNMLAVYGRAGQNCLNCRHNIVRIEQAGRSTFLCQSCQH